MRGFVETVLLRLDIVYFHVYSHIPNRCTYIYVYLFSENLQPYTTLFGSIRLLDL